VSVSGTAPPPDGNAGAEQGQSGQQGRDAQQGGGETSGVTIQQVPGRLNGYLPTWLLAVALAAGFAFLGFLLWNKKVVTVAVPAADGAHDDVATKPKKTKQPAPPVVDKAPTITPTNGASSLNDLDAAIGTSLDALKERLFRLELRRQAGTISDEEYAQERARAEKVLRDLVRG
jgi:hypothetical protein